MAIPEPIDWLRGYARVQQLADREILRSIARAHWDIGRMLREYEGKASLTMTDLVRIEQLKTIQRNMLREQAKIWAKLGDVIRARRLEAVAQAIQLGSAIDTTLLGAVGREEDARALKRSLVAGAEQTMNTALTRMVVAVPLSQRIYTNRVWMDGRIQRLINSAILRGLSAREFAKEARNWFNPDTPGGVRYAALRLARTEINNAFHATSILQAQEKPWIASMKWHLSRSHPKADTCDLYAKGGKEGDGVYAKNDVPRKPHPQCLCFVTPTPVDEDKFLDNLVAGRYDDYLNSKMNRV